MSAEWKRLPSYAKKASSAIAAISERKKIPEAWMIQAAGRRKIGVTGLLDHA
jgi:hypothetical protein